MSASHCEKCKAEGKTYWVNDKEWLCGKCFKEAKMPKAASSISQFVCGLQLPDEYDEF